MPDVREYGLFIDGDFVASSSRETLTSVDPSTGEPVAITPKAGPRDARRAVEAARRAFDDGGWRKRSIGERCELLLRVCDVLAERAEQIAELEARDTGMTIRLARLMIGAGIQQARELVATAASIPMVETITHPEYELSSQHLLVRDPYGVVVAITPFNAPFVLSAWKLFPALAMGNSVVLKPSPLTPCSVMEMATAFAACDLPAGVLNVLPGAGVDAGEELVANPLVDRVAFTGSTEAGRRISELAAATVKHVTLELGGKSANIMLEDADLDAAIPGSLWAVYLHQGQTCQAGSRLYVPASIHDEVVDRLIAGATRLRLGPTLSEDTDLGPLISEQQLQRVERYVRIARDEGAVLACGGRRLTEDGLERGLYHAPTIFTGVRDDMRIANEEVFGPVLAVIPYRSVDDAVAAANRSIYGLAAGVWSADTGRALALAMQLQAGTVWVNDWHMLATFAPYGGYKQSGLGKELGVEGCTAYTQTKHIWVDHTPVGQPRAWSAALHVDQV